MAPDIKSALKEAKAGIKESNYEQVLKYCKIVLKHDRNNYQALVMFARACQELKKFEDSKKALLLASTIDADSPVAWQGLATLFETQPQLSTPKEAVVVYIKLVALVEDGPKHISFLRKLAAAQETDGNSFAATDTLLKLLPLVKETDKHAERETAQRVVNLLAPVQHNLSQQRTASLITTLESLLSDSVLGNNETNYKLYLSLIYKSCDAQQLVNAAIKMSSVFPTAYPLEWIARVFVENQLPWKGNEASSVSWEDCEASITRLLQIYSASLWGNLALGLQYQKSGNLQSAVPRYSAACERSASSFSNSAGQPIIWWRLLLEALTIIKDWPSVESTTGRILALLKDTNATWPIIKDEEYLNNLQLLRAKALMQLGHKKHYSDALSILRKLGDIASMLIVRCLLHIDLTAARQEIEALLKTNKSPMHDLLYAQLLYSEKDLTAAKDSLDILLKEDPNNAEALVLLGRIHQETGDNTSSLSCLLRAAKLDATQGAAFLYLGHYYRHAGDQIKACKCYQKAYALSPVGEEEGAALSDIYRELGDHNKNFALLSAVTTGSSSKGAWAWLRLGLHHLSQHNPQAAISALQRSLQLHHDHRQALESLGDAYLARGSYVAAQKVHERVLLLDPTAVYPRCQIAKIQLCVGEPLIAVKEYETVLELCVEDNHLRSVTLLGLAQAHYVLATTNADIALLDNTLSHCVQAIKALDKARELQPNSISVWKTMGDACGLLHRLPRYLADSGIRVPARLVKPNCDADAMTRINLAAVLQLATKCYGAALQINSEHSTLWHDMGLSCYLDAKYQYKQEGKSKGSDEVASKMRRAVNCLKKSLSLLALSSETWNTLGVVLVHPAMDDRKVAQHCFIRSVQLKPSPNNWTHLGAFYLVCNEVQLAHQAFCQAQAIDPRFVTCWTGQALVAESVQHYDAADLFRHCCTIGVHPESCLGHAHHVLMTLSENKKPTPSVLALAADSMLFYSREFDSDALGMNLAGLCLEQIGMKHTAADLYHSALTTVTQNSSDSSDDGKLADCIRNNYGRILTSLGRVQEAAEQLSAISEPDFQTECILALACLKGEDFETGYTKYMSALHWLAQNHQHKANVLVALACLQYKFKKIQEAKTLLFESCGEGGGCVSGILALGALGLVEGDSTLITAALNELQPHKDSEEAAHHVAFLTAAKAIVKGEHVLAKNILSRALLYRPQSPELWRFLSWHLLTMQSNKNIAPSQRRQQSYQREAEKMSRGIVSCASAATTLSQSGNSSIKLHSLPTQDGSMRVLGLMQCGNTDRAMKEAQRCLLMHPADPESWATLVVAAKATKQPCYTNRIKNMTEVWASKCSGKVQQWLLKNVVVA
uniref:Tetratricopeptide repeat protein 37-like n=1 Tax=Hirondellea gigas TaxID=1518452 RepID=A0A2P2I5I3_9CRUS